MTTASGLPAFIDQLVVVANAAFGSTSAVEVFDGPGVSEDDTGQQLWIGVSDLFGDVAESATGDQDWPYSSSTFRREELTVHCVAKAWAGDDDMKTVRDQVFAQMNAFVAAVVTDATLSGAVLMARSAGRNATLSQGYTAKGATAVLAFDIAAMNQYQN